MGTLSRAVGIFLVTRNSTSARFFAPGIGCADGHRHQRFTLVGEARAEPAGRGLELGGGVLGAGSSVALCARGEPDLSRGQALALLAPHGCDQRGLAPRVRLDWHWRGRAAGEHTEKVGRHLRGGESDNDGNIR